MNEERTFVVHVPFDYETSGRSYPVLRVRNLEHSIQFYTEMLGFVVDWGGHEGSDLCSVSRDGCCIMLSEEDRGHFGTWVWVGLGDDSLFADFKSRGVKVVQEPWNCPWAYETKIEDVDGNVLWLGTEPKKDVPFAVRVLN